MVSARKRKHAYGEMRYGYTADGVANTPPDMLKQAFNAIAETGYIASGIRVIDRSRWLALLHFNSEVRAQARELAFRQKSGAAGLFVAGEPSRNKGRLRAVCKNGHPISGDNVHFESGGKKRLCLICHRQRRKMYDANGSIGEHRIRRILAALENGATIGSLTGTRAAKRCGVKLIVRHTVLAAFSAKHPQLGRFIYKRASENVERQRLERRALIRVTAPTIVLARSLDIWEVIRAAVPPRWPEEMRNEAISRVGLEVCDGRCKPTETAIGAAILRAGVDHNRMFSEYAMGGGAGKWVSLEAPKYEDGATTVGDTVSEGLWG
jgi:hypothetical protein